MCRPPCSRSYEGGVVVLDGLRGGLLGVCSNPAAGRVLAATRYELVDAAPQGKERCGCAVAALAASLRGVGVGGGRREKAHRLAPVAVALLAPTTTRPDAQLKDQEKIEAMKAINIRGEPKRNNNHSHSVVINTKTMSEERRWHVGTLTDLSACLTDLIAYV